MSGIKCGWCGCFVGYGEITAKRAKYHQNTPEGDGEWQCARYVEKETTQPKEPKQ